MTMPRQQQEAHFREATARYDRGDFAGAVALLHPLSQLRRRDARLLRLLGSAQSQAGSVPLARETLKRALALQPALAEAYRDLAACDRMEGRFDEALVNIDTGLRLRSDHTELLAYKSDLLCAFGRADEAHDLLAPLIEKGKDAKAPWLALAYATACARSKRHELAAAVIRRQLENQELGSHLRTHLLFTLGASLDKLGEYEDAFAAFREANEMVPAPFDAHKHRQRIDETIESWSREAIADASKGRSVESPIFIVGMARSGTTLVEQILASHPAVQAGGERIELPQVAHRLAPKMDPSLGIFFNQPEKLTEKTVASASAWYLKATGADQASRFIDKLPDNFIRLGMIACLFPSARIIHCTRNPIDTCLSCYFHKFRGSIPYAYNLKSLGAYYNDYRRLMRHWKTTIDLPIMDVSYEELIKDQETVSRRLVSFVGLEWDNACLRFYETKRIANTNSMDQVRQPVYTTSVERWRHYETHLGDLLAAIDESASE